MRILILGEDGNSRLRMHVLGSLNRIGSGISRWNREEMQANLSALSALFMAELPLSAQGLEVCSGVFAADSFDTSSRNCLNELMRGISDLGLGSDSA